MRYRLTVRINANDRRQALAYAAQAIVENLVNFPVETDTVRTTTRLESAELERPAPQEPLPMDPAEYERWQLVLNAAVDRFEAAPDDVAVQDETMATMRLVLHARKPGYTLPERITVFLPLLRERGLVADGPPPAGGPV